jgi:maltokinase
MDSEHQLTSDQLRDLAELLGQWLPGRRWFSGKGREVTDTRICDVTELPGSTSVLSVILGVQLDGQHWQTYQVPLSLYGAPQAELPVVGQLMDGQWAHDALADPTAVRTLLIPAQGEATVDPDLTHQLVAGSSHPVPQLQAVSDPEAYLDLPLRPMGVEQSNTSVILGKTTLVKFFRQLMPGVNPDVEVHAALAVARCPHVGQTLGWVNAGWRNPQDGAWFTGHTAMVQKLIVPAVEGRELALSRLAAGESFADEAYELGRATGAVHQDMRQSLPGHVLSEQEVSDLVDRLHWRLDQCVAAVPDLEEIAPALHARIDAVLELKQPLEVQRVHGDLHLQQVLRGDDGWKLLDFEGEPGSTMAARTTPDHALRDVAGMLRSFAYAAAQGGAEKTPSEVAAWLADCEQAFLAGYAQAQAGDPQAGGATTPHDEYTDRVVLDAYLVDKAAYEAAYEQRNRPDWLPIPMAALKQLAD